MTTDEIKTNEIIAEAIDKLIEKSEKSRQGKSQG